MIQKKPKRLPADYYFKPDEQDPHLSVIHRSIHKDKDGRRLADNELNILVPHAAAQAIEAAQQLRNERRFKAVNLLEERRLRREQARPSSTLFSHFYPFSGCATYMNQSLASIFPEIPVV